MMKWQKTKENKAALAPQNQPGLLIKYFYLNLFCLHLVMNGNFKILLLFLTLALSLVPVTSMACSLTARQDVQLQPAATTFSQSSQDSKPACDISNCEDECCHPKSHDCQTEGCSGNCSGNLCGAAQYPVLSDSRSLEDSKNQEYGYYDSNSNFYYQNPSYSGGFHTIWQPPKIG